MLLSCIAAKGQDKKVYEWEAKPVMHKISSVYAKESAVIILDEANIEYRDEVKSIYVYRSVHRIVKVLDDKGIEEFNKITLPVTNGKTLEYIKARTILPGGKIIEVGMDKVKKTKNEDGTQAYLFAMEGVEKNCEVELQYTERKPISLFGAELYQYGIPVMQGKFSLSVPEKMIFRVKGYNGFPVANDTLIDGTRYYSASVTSVPALHQEAYGNEEAAQMRVEYKLEYLANENPDLRMLTWTDLAKQLFTNYYNISTKEAKATRKYLDQIGVKSDDAEEDKIRKIEDDIKNNIVLNRSLSGEDVAMVDKTLINKTTDEGGLARLYIACFTLADVKNEFGLSTNKFEHPFDESFENWNYMDTYVFYFPNQKKFLTPSSIYYRYPVVPASLLANKGVFCRIGTDGDTKVHADIREITPLPLKESENNIYATVSFTNDDLDPQIEVMHTFSGYCAMGIREAFVLLPKERQKETVYGIVNLSDKDEDVLNYKTANSAFHNYYDNKPLKLSATIKASQLMEKAGPKYLFKIGEVIGRQTELYQSTKRVLPIDIPFPHSEKRIITVNIPQGYKILNPEATRKNVSDKDDNIQPTMGFTSDYKMEGSQMIVTINEFYSQLHYPVSFYENLRKVINASADFNKVVLVMVKG